ncbi:transcriptional regulator, partial [Streptomyces sp. NPDC028635]
LDVPVPPATGPAPPCVLTPHPRAAAGVRGGGRGAGAGPRGPQDVKSLSAHMHPLVVQALLTTFQRSLREELREWLDGAEE